MNNSVDEKKLYVPNITLLVSLTLVVLGVVIGGIALYLNSKPAFVFKKVINASFMKIENMLDDSMNYNNVSSKVKFDFDIKANDESVEDLLKVINGLDVELNSIVDYKEKTAAFNIYADYDYSKLIDVRSYIEGKRVYFDVKDILDNPVYFDMDEELSIENTIDYSKINILMDSVRSAINTAIKDEYIIKEKDNNYDKYILTIDKSNIQEISSRFLRVLKNDDKFIKAVASLSEFNKDEIISNLEELIDEINNEDISDFSGIITVTFYMDHNTLKQADIYVGDNEEEATIQVKVVDEKTISYSVVCGDNKVSGELVTDVKSENSTSYNLTFIVTDEGEEQLDLTLKLDVTNTYNVKMDKSMTVNAIPFENMDEEKASEKVQNNKTMTQFTEDLESAFSGLFSFVDDDYDFEYDDDDFEYEDFDIDYDYITVE